jgi:hypothetical protein
MPPAGFELAIPTGERPQTHALDRAAIGIGKISNNSPKTETSQQLPYRKFILDI